MIPGPYAICHVTFASEGTDNPTYASLRWGYNSANQAYAALPAVVAEAGIPADECAVIRHIDREEAEEFRH